MSTQEYRNSLREAGRQIAAENKARRFAERAASPGSRYVYASLPRCPACGGTEHRSYRSVDQGDGSRMKWTACKACGEKFVVILE